MPLVNAKCTNCGANLRADDSKDAAICEFCGSAYIVEKAVQNFQVQNNYSGQVVNVYNYYNTQTVSQPQSAPEPDNQELICHFSSVIYMPGKNRKIGAGVPIDSIDVFSDRIEILPFSNGKRLKRFPLPEKLLYSEMPTYSCNQYSGWNSFSFTLDNGSSHTLIFKRGTRNCDLFFQTVENAKKR